MTTQTGASHGFWSSSKWSKSVRLLRDTLASGSGRNELPDEKAVAVRLDASRYLDSRCSDIPARRGPLGLHLLGGVGPTMTPQEIRAQGNATSLSQTDLILTELTAQIAEVVGELREIKSDMKRVDEQLFGGKT